MNSNTESSSKYQAIFDKYSNQNFKIRELEHADYNKGTRYYELLGSGFKAPKVEESEFIKQLDLIKNESAPHVIAVIEDIEKKLVIASGTVLMERKFIRNNSIVSISSIFSATGCSHRGDCCTCRLSKKWLWEDVDLSNYVISRLLETLKAIAVAENSYKIILDCQEALVPFYEKVGFSKNGIAMKLYVESDTKKESTNVTNSK